MRPPPPLSSLPPSLLVLVLPLILPSTVVAAPNNARRETSILRRDAEIREELPRHPAAGVKKMSEDEGEKFYFDYWYFDHVTNIPGSDGELQPGNSSLVDTNTPYQLPFPLHSDHKSGLFSRYLNLLSKSSGFQCPGGTSSCTNINRPNSCCAKDETCQLIPDTGLGDVGCCSSGDDCGGGLSGCEKGYTSCPDSPGGGCCIPGYSCSGEGCVIVQTETVTLTRTRESTTFTSTSTSTSTLASTSSSDTQTSTSTSTSTSATCDSPPCQTTTGTTQTIAPPVRPTTNPGPTTTNTQNPSSCPTGFYGCSAVYAGGCCRTGRDCNTTSCPTTSSTTLVNEDGKTIVVPADGATAPTEMPTGRCAEGWFGCGKEDGGGCCPEGFGCEVRSCTAEEKGAPTGEVGKIAAEGGAGVVGIGMGWVFGWVVGILVVI